MWRRGHTACLLISMTVAAHAACAGEMPQTIYDSGETLPIAPYYERLAPDDDTPVPAAPTSLEHDQLPIRTPALSTGEVAEAMVPGAFLMPPAIAHLSAVLLGALAVRRALEARRVLRYQRTLRRLPRYTLKAHRLPLSRTRLFLGRGFRWTQQHTQRLHDAQQPAGRRGRGAPAGRRGLEARALVWERRRYTRPLMALLRWEHRCNPLRPRSALGGLPQLHTVEPDEHDVWMRLDERPGHMLVIGTTRVGKTRFEELLVAQDIRRGDVVVVI